MEWGDVTNWVMHGGSFLGTQKQLPLKILSQVADALEDYQIHALLIIGGFEVRNVWFLFYNQIHFSDQIKISIFLLQLSTILGL